MRYKERVFTTFWHSESAAFADLTERASWSQVFDSGIEVNSTDNIYTRIQHTLYCKYHGLILTHHFYFFVSSYIMQIRKCHGRLLIIRSPMLMLFEFWIMMPRTTISGP